MNPEDAVWYENRPLGVNKLGEMMKTISIGAKLSQLYTNRSVCASAITLLSDANVPDHHIMFISGKSSRQSIAHYSSQRSVNSWKMCATPSQMHLKISNHRAQKFPPSLLLHSSKARTEWSPTFRCRPQPQVAFLTPVKFRAMSRCFSAYRPPSNHKNWLDFLLHFESDL